MTAAIGIFLIFALLGWVFFGIVGFLPTRLQTFFLWPISPSPVLRSAAWLATGAFIVVSELLAPSIPATGLKPAPQSEPIERLRGPEWTEAVLTYDDVAELEPWLWHLGLVSRFEIRDRLVADIRLLAQARTLLRTLGEPGGESYDYGTANWASDALATGQTLRRALLAAIRDLDRLPGGETAMVMGAEADLFVIEHIERTYREAVTDAEVAVAAASDAYTAALTPAPPGTPSMSETPRQQALRNALDKESEAYATLAAAFPAIQRTLEDARYAASTASPERPFPDLEAPVTAITQTFAITEPPEIQTGPSPGFSAGASLRRVADALTGRTRLPAEWSSYQACSVAVADSDTGPFLSRVCRLVRPLFIDYDITASACGSEGDVGPPLSNPTCRESWITPNLIIDFTTDTFTIHAPKPTNADVGSVPISRWVAVWGGVEKPLTPTATFDWDPLSLELPGVILRHEGRPSTGTSRVWQDFRRDRPFRIMTDAPPGEEYVSSEGATLPITIEAMTWQNQAEFVPEFLALGQNQTNLVSGRAGSHLAEILVERQFLLSNGKGESGTIRRVLHETPLSRTWENPPCTRPRAHRGNFYWEIEIDPAKSGADKMITTADCENIRAADALLEAMIRESFPGTWVSTVFP